MGIEVVWSPRMAHESFSDNKKEVIETMNAYGFFETEEMTALREQIAVAPERLIELSGPYADKGMEGIDSADFPHDRGDATIGLNFSKVLLYLEAKHVEGAIEVLRELEEVSFSTHNGNLEVLVKAQLASLEARK